MDDGADPHSDQQGGELRVVGGGTDESAKDCRTARDQAQSHQTASGGR